MKINQPLWKISLAVWLPVLILAVISYSVAYAVMYNKAKDRRAERIATAQRCKQQLDTLSQPEPATGEPQNSSQAHSKPDSRLAGLGQKYGGNFGGGVSSLPPSIDTINHLENCANADTGMGHGLLFLPE